MLGKMLENVRKSAPLVHCITNYVTVNDCANMLLACGGSPIMADDEGEAEEITSICGALVINLGTPNKNTIPSMFLSGKKANALGKPVILDPVGAGASRLRTETALRLLEEVRFAAVRGNISEIKALAGSGGARGVDADISDMVTEDNLGEAVAFAKAFSARTGAVTAITGAVDIVADSGNAYIIRNGHPMMARITGSGCMLTAMCGAYLAANPGKPLEAMAAAICSMGVSGELAYEKLQRTGGGNSTYRDHLIDSVYNLDIDTFSGGAKYEIR